MSNETSWPSANDLRIGVIIASIAQAIRIAADPLFAHEQSWDQGSYSIQDSSGSRGTITFSEGAIVGAFFSHTSPRNPLLSIDTTYNAKEYFDSAPSSVLEIAESEALQYLLQDLRGTIKPVVTTVLWSVGNELTSIDSRPAFIENGGHLIAVQLLGVDDGIAKWIKLYELTKDQELLFYSLVHRKLSNPNTLTLLSNEELRALFASGRDGEQDAYEVLQAVGIVLSLE